jgi:glycerophosphoryl diester phosphodiesterase
MTFPLLIAHRGACGYLPEHTLAAKVLAYAMGADYLEQDVVASADGELVVLHDIYLDRVTDVADRFPTRCRPDGRYYVRDFQLAELRSLKIWERMHESGAAVYPDRYPTRTGEFRIHTLAEEIDVIQHLNTKSGRIAGIYPEIKRPEWHREEGIDIAPQLLEILAHYGYRSKTDAIFLQCFDAAELRRIRHELRSPLRLVQLIGENHWGESNTDYAAMLSKGGMDELASTVDAIGPWVQHLYEFDATSGEIQATSLLQDAHALGLEVHPYTFRADELPLGFDSFTDLIRYFSSEQLVDAVFTDFPDLVIKSGFGSYI